MPGGHLLDRVFSRLAEHDLDARLASGFGQDLIERLLGALEENGFALWTDSWREAGEMKPISSEDMEAGVGSALMFDMTSGFGLSPGEVSDLLAKHLPGMVRQLRGSGPAATEAPGGAA